MLFGGEHASHLCHHTNCVNHEHLVVEGKGANEARKACNGKVCVTTIRCLAFAPISQARFAKQRWHT